MKKLDENFKKFINEEDSFEINNFLISLSKKPEKNQINIINYVMQNSTELLFDKIKLNLIFLLGEIGGITKLEDKYLNILVDNYYNSDRWVRNEIIQAITKIHEENDYNDEIQKIIAFALLEDYLPTKKNALDALKNLDIIPDLIIGNLIRILDCLDLKLLEDCLDLLKIQIKNEIMLFNFLNLKEYYKILNKNIVRTLLLTYFEKIKDLEVFQEEINKSNWEEEYKSLINNEIDIYRQILLKNI